MRRTIAAAVLIALLALLTAATAAARPVAHTVLRLVDRGRAIRLPNGHRVARTLITDVRYPAARGAHPLIVFAHGFDITPGPYARLLDAWASAGYVVAAPLFPLTNRRAPGGPREDDIVNEPRDISFVISRLLAARGALAGRIDGRRVGVAGHSDGAVVALTVGCDRRLRDPRVRAAIVMSGAATRPFSGFAPNAAALLATQGTADTTNTPANSYALFHAAPRPKFLLRLLSAGHLPPYTGQQPQLGIVERVTVAFLDRYLKRRPRALRRLRRTARVRGKAALTATP